MSSEPGPARFLVNGGACATLIAGHDWAATSIGPIASWPAALSATVGNMLHTQQPMLLFWGPELIQFYNDAFVPSFGRGKHPEAMGQGARACWADAWPVIGAQIEAVMRRGEPAWFQDALVPVFRNGRMEEVFWTYSYSPAFDDRGEIYGTLVIVTETTDRVTSGRRLEALAQLGLDLATAATEAAAFDAVGRVAATWASDLPMMVVASQNAVRTVGVAPDRASAIAAAGLAADLAHGPREIALEAGVAGPVWPEPVTTMFAAAVGTQHVLLLGVSPRLPLDDGYRRFAAQIVEQLASALARIDTLRALEAANRTKDDFLAMLGHELRNPLAPIVTALELMNAKDEGAARPPERVVIERQIKHVVRLVDDLLDLAKITRGMLTLHRDTVDIGGVLEAAVEMTAYLMAQRGHHLTTSVPRGVFVNGDESRLSQVLANLLTNAARYTANGGEIRASATATRDEVAIEIADNGSGIAPALLPRIFDSFVQGQRKADRAEGGLGLGLAIVKSLVAMHGGDVAIHSAGADRGTTVVVRLPRAAPAAEPPDPVAATATPASLARRVLVVDDNEDAAEMLGELVRMRGHDVTVVHHPVAALAIVDELRPEVALLDLGLPEMDGYELAARLRERRPECRLIALTGYGQDSDRARTAAAGFIAHLVKPVKIAALLELLAQ